MKKLLLTLGAVTAVVAPIATIISCNDSGATTNKDLQAKKISAKAEINAMIKAKSADNVALTKALGEIDGAKTTTAIDALLNGVRMMTTQQGTKNGVQPKWIAGIETDLTEVKSIAIKSLAEYAFHSEKEKPSTISKINDAKNIEDVDAAMSQLSSMGIAFQPWAAKKYTLLNLYMSRLEAIEGLTTSQANGEKAGIEAMVTALTNAHDAASIGAAIKTAEAARSAQGK